MSLEGKAPGWSKKKKVFRLHLQNTQIERPILLELISYFIWASFCRKILFLSQRSVTCLRSWTNLPLPCCSLGEVPAYSDLKQVFGDQVSAQAKVVIEPISKKIFFSSEASVRQQLGHARGYPKFAKDKISSDHKPPKMFYNFSCAP